MRLTARHSYVTCLALLAFAACTPVGAQGGAEPTAAGSGDSVAGITWSVPGQWQRGRKRPMRVVTYSIPRLAGDSEDGSCAVYYFGANQGGGVRDNIDRWIGQMQTKDGKPVSDHKTEAFEVGGIKITRVDVSGTYLFSPSPMAPNKIPKPNFRMVAAIVEAPGGSVFFKLTAPQKTAEAAAKSLDTLLRSLTKT